MIHIYDGLNIIRQRIDKDPLGRAPRSIVTSMQCALPGDVHIWTFEGARSLKRRREVFSGYKDRPSTHTTGLFALQELIRDALEHTPAFQVDVPEFEADDLIAHFTCKYAGRDEIRIHTTDRDLNQLLVLPGVTSDAEGIPHAHPKHVRLYKTFVGDVSDRIPGLRGMGRETWIGCDKDKLLVAFKNPRQGLYVDAGLTPRLAQKAVEEHDTLKGFWDIVGFFPVPENVSDYIKGGKPDPVEADRILKQFNH